MFILLEVNVDVYIIAMQFVHLYTLHVSQCILMCVMVKASLEEVLKIADF